MDFTDRVVVITGGARGIGLAITKAYARAGAKVLSIDAMADHIQSAAADVADNENVLFEQGDVTNYEALEEIFKRAEARFGAIDTVVNNAGITPKKNGYRVEAPDMEIDEWRRVIDVNLNGAFNTIRLALPSMRERKRGWIVNQASVAAKVFFPPAACHYAASKAGLVGLTMHLAGELGPYNIRVNAMAPGRIDTPLMRAVQDGVNERIEAETPMRRFGTTEEVANVCLFLTSDLSSFVTGQVIDIAGGWMMAV